MIFNSSLTASKELPLWEAHVGIAGMNLPHYRGSESSSTRWIPFPSLTYRGEFFKASDGKLQGLLYSSDKVKLDISLSGSFPASPEDNSARRGMPELDATFEIGPSVTSHLWQSINQNTNITLEIPIRSAFSLNTDNWAIKSHGWTLAPSINLHHKYNSWDGGLSLGPVYGSRRYHSYFYDVPEQYETFGRSVYQSTSGYSGSRVILSLNKRINKWSFKSFIRYDMLSNAVFMDSPLIERSNNLSFGFVLMWQFAKSETLVNQEN